MPTNVYGMISNVTKPSTKESGNSDTKAPKVASESEKGTSEERESERSFPDETGLEKMCVLSRQGWGRVCQA